MDTQCQDHSGKKSLSGASKRPDAFWGLIVPSVRLKKGRLESTAGACPSNPQTHHVEELKHTQSVVRQDKGTLHPLPRLNGTELCPHLGARPKDTKHVEHPSTTGNPADRYASIVEEVKRTHAQPVIRREKGRPEPTARAQPAHPYTSLTRHLKHTRPVESDESADDDNLSEGHVLGPSSALHKGDKDELSSEGPDDTEESEGDEDYVEDDNENDSETVFEGSGPTTQSSTPSYVTSRRARAMRRSKQEKGLKESSKATAPKRKTAPSQLASAKGRKSRKKVKFVVEKSDEQGDEEEEEEEAADRSVHGNRKFAAKAGGQWQSFPILPPLPPLSRLHQPWTKKEEKTLFALRNRGKSWKYIGERVLGRTLSGAKGHWDHMRAESLKPVETKAKRDLQPKSSVISVMAKIPKIHKAWTKEEDNRLANLRAQGKTLMYISRHTPGKGYSACKVHWRRIKDQYPQAVTASQDPEFDQKENSSSPQDTHTIFTSQVDQETNGAEPESRVGIFESEDPRLSTNGNSLIGADVDNLSVKQPYEEAVVAHVSLPSAIAGQSPQYKAISKDDHDQQASKMEVDPTPSIDGPAHEHQADPGPVLIREDVENKKEWSPRDDRLLSSLRKESMNWEDIADRIPDRNNDECEERYESMRAIYGPNEPSGPEREEEQGKENDKGAF